MMDPQMEDDSDVAVWEAFCWRTAMRAGAGNPDDLADIVNALYYDSPLLLTLVHGICAQDPARDTTIEHALRLFVETGITTMADNWMEEHEYRD
jgi:hypothetical protein